MQYSTYLCLILSFILTTNINKFESCITGFFSNGQRAVAIVKGSVGGSTIQGRIDFYQNVYFNENYINRNYNY